MPEENNAETMPTSMMSGIKKPAPLPIVKEKKACRICTNNPETPYIVEKCIVVILATKNGNCGSLEKHDKVQVEAIVRAGVRIVKVMLAGYWLKIPEDCIVQKVCSGCGKPIANSSTGIVK